jgi:novobiocin biosynthesis protein NovU/D-mycarose 3-C-methyltransferase
LANAFLVEPADFETEQFFPLDVYFCRSCTLVQLLDVVDPAILFRDYVYVTGTSDTMRAHNASYASAVVELLAAKPEDLVVEIASNDGSLMKCFAGHGVRTLGIEPATNIAAMAREDGVDTVNEFFSLAVAKDVRRERGPARAVVANNVLAHVDETVDFLLGCRELVTDDGLVIIEVPYLGELLTRLEYDTIYHEHLCYFSVMALMRLFESAGLSVVSVEEVPVHGGSIRVSGRRSNGAVRHAPGVEALAKRELERGFSDLATYQQFARNVDASKWALRRCLEFFRSEGKSVAGYGAPAKGNTLLNYCQIDPSLMAFTVDKSPLKVGRFTPGTHVPILAADELRKRRPDYAVILAWNFAAEIMRQQAAFLDAGGKFILPLPTPHIEGKS